MQTNKMFLLVQIYEKKLAVYVQMEEMLMIYYM